MGLASAWVGLVRLWSGFGTERLWSRPKPAEDGGSVGELDGLRQQVVAPLGVLLGVVVLTHRRVVVEAAVGAAVAAAGASPRGKTAHKHADGLAAPRGSPLVTEARCGHQHIC